MDSLSDGLGEFSTQLCRRIATNAADWHRQGVSVELHMKKRWHGAFGDDVVYLPAERKQEKLHWQDFKRFDVWHCLHQLDRIGPPLRTRHAILTIHDLNVLYGGDAQAARWAISRLKKQIRSYDKLTTISQHVKNDIGLHLRWTKAIELIPNGVSDSSARPQESIGNLSSGTYFLHLSRMAPSKNPGCLLDLAAIWPDRLFVMAGPGGSYFDQVAQAVKARNLENVRLLNDVNEAQKTWLYAHCIAFLFPSLTEGFGLPPLEAMCFGKPVFLSNRTSLPEIGGTAAAYFQSFSAYDMRSVIESELPRLQAAADEIRKHAAGFDWGHAAHAYFRLYAAKLHLNL